MHMHVHVHVHVPIDSILQTCKHAGMHTLCDLCVSRLSTLYTPDKQVDDFAVAQRTPLPEYVAGIEGDKV